PAKWSAALFLWGATDAPRRSERCGADRPRRRARLAYWKGRRHPSRARAYGGKNGGERPPRHDVAQGPVHVVRIEIMHYAGAHMGGADRESRLHWLRSEKSTSSLSVLRRGRSSNSRHDRRRGGYGRRGM